jgi:hypothetical protein
MARWWWVCLPKRINQNSMYVDIPPLKKEMVLKWVHLIDVNMCKRRILLLKEYNCIPNYIY